MENVVFLEAWCNAEANVAFFAFHSSSAGTMRDCTTSSGASRRVMVSFVESIKFWYLLSRNSRCISHTNTNRINFLFMSHAFCTETSINQVKIAHHHLYFRKSTSVVLNVLIHLINAAHELVVFLN